MRKGLIKIPILIFMSAFGTPNAKATSNYAAAKAFKLDVSFVEALEIEIDDISVNDAVGGDTIDINVPIRKTSTNKRKTMCDLSDDKINLSYDGAVGTGDASSFDLDVSLNRNCTRLRIDGVLPENAMNSAKYEGFITITYAYQVHSFRSANVRQQTRYNNAGENKRERMKKRFNLRGIIFSNPS